MQPDLVNIVHHIILVALYFGGLGGVFWGGRDQVGRFTSATW